MSDNCDRNRLTNQFLEAQKALEGKGMKPWRERIVEAREQGRFTENDRNAWQKPQMCLVGEMVMNIKGEYDPSVWMKINHPLGDGRLAGLNTGLCTALKNNDFDFVERRLEEIEDHAMHLKREGLV